MTTTENALNVLPFNPKSDVYDCFKAWITPIMAQHILDYYNKDNRKISNSQVNKIFRSIENDNWLLDGQPMSFNTDGNLTEFQHRLKAIAKCQRDRIFEIVVVVGVQKECFSKTATNKSRKPIDEIQRKHYKAHKDEVSVLGDILKRQRKWRLTMQNAISAYENWFKNISNSLTTSGDYENLMDKFSLQRKTVRSYISLCERHGYLEDCKIFLELLDNELDDNAETPVSTLSSQFLKYWNSTAVDLSNEKRMDVLYSLLCAATDRIIMRDDGMIELDITSSDLEHDKMENKGVYRKFLA
jgi:hypothetical protein